MFSIAGHLGGLGGPKYSQGVWEQFADAFEKLRFLTFPGIHVDLYRGRSMYAHIRVHPLFATETQTGNLEMQKNGC